MTENKGLISAPEMEQSANSSTALKEKALERVKAGEFASALVTAEGINNEWQKVEALKAIADAAPSRWTPSNSPACFASVTSSRTQRHISAARCDSSGTLCPWFGGNKMGRGVYRG